MYRTTQDIVLQQEYSDTFCNSLDISIDSWNYVWFMQFHLLWLEHNCHINWGLPVQNGDFAISGKSFLGMHYNYGSCH
jgi:hypothetical protein